MIKSIPSISSEVDEEKIFKIINENFSQLAPAYYTLVTHWLINAYKLIDTLMNLVSIYKPMSN